MDNLIKKLYQFGLSNKEAGVYLSSLNMGPASVQDLSHKAKVNRATTYVVIEALTQKGLMSTFVKGKKRYYSAETPERLMSILQLKRQEINEKEKELSEALPLLMALFNVEGAKPQIRYLEGIEGLATTREQFEKLEGEFVQIINFDEAREIAELQEGQEQHIKNISKTSTPSRVLLVTNDQDFSHIPDIANSEIRIISAKDFPLQGEITVRQDHIFLFSYRSAVLSVVIRSKEISGAILTLFNLAWQGSKNAPARKTQ